MISTVCIIMQKVVLKTGVHSNTVSELVVVFDDDDDLKILLMIKLFHIITR